MPLDFYSHIDRTSQSDMTLKNSNIEKKESNMEPIIKNDSNTATTLSFEATHADPADRGTKRGLKPRHAQMIALGGSIGTGLFVGSGATLARGGPAFILASYILVSIVIYCVVTSLVEVATYNPVSGASMAYYGARNVSNSLGFSMGWLYFYSLGILVPYEITAGALVIDYWNNPINIGVWITIFIIVIVGLNFLPVKVYGETEFWFASIKVFTIIGLLLLSFILFWGGGPTQDSILGFGYWKDPGATNTWLVDGDMGRFVAFFGTLISSTFPFAFAPELLIFASGEMKSPEINLPKAAKRYIWRLLIFYICSILAIGVICPYTNSDLTGGGAGAKSSAFVAGINNAGIHGLGSVVNAAILTSAWSSGNSFLYMSARALYSMAIAGHAPAIFKRCNKHGVPYYAVGAAALFTPLAYLNVGNSSSIVFEWFVNLTTISGFISWICCSITFLRFRAACKAQSQHNIPYRSIVQPYGAWIALVFFTFLALINGFNVFIKGQFTTAGFLTAYIGIPAFLVIFFGHKVLKGRSEPWALPAEAVNLEKEYHPEGLNEDEKFENRHGWKKWADRFV